MSSSVKSADRVITILTFLASRPAPVQSVVIARQCALPRSSTYHLLNVLKDRGWVTYYADGRRWGLGSAVVPVAAAYRRTWPVGLVAGPLLERLAGKVGAWAYVARFANGRLVRCADCEPQGKTSVRQNTAWAGAPHVSAAGRALLAPLPPRTVLQHCGGVSPLPWPGSTPIRLDDLVERMRSERSLGVHTDQYGARGGPQLAVAVGEKGRPPAACVGVAYQAGQHAQCDALEHVNETAGDLLAALAQVRGPDVTEEADLELAA